MSALYNTDLIPNVAFDESVFDEPILIVDDSNTCLNMMHAVYVHAGFTNLLTAKNGQEALDLTRAHNPSLVVLDISMPVLDGIEYCKQIRAEDEFKSLPIMVQSATTDTEDVSSAFKAGANDFISKPPGASELISRTMIHLTRVSLQRDLMMYKNRMDADLRVARGMQASIMPSSDEIHDYNSRYKCDITSLFEPSDELGGDFWGMRALTPTQMAIYNIDLSGHGVAAALNTFRLQAILNEAKSYFAEPSVCISSINDRLNNLLDVGQYATVFYGVIDMEENVINYVLTGAPEPMIMTKDGSLKILEGRGVPVGAVKHINYDMYQHPFYPGETLLTYSDALIETANTEGEFFTADEIIDSLRKTDGKASQMKLDGLMHDFRAFIGKDTDIADDLTVVVLSRES